MSQDRTMVRAGVSALPRHEAWPDRPKTGRTLRAVPQPEASGLEASRGLVDRAIVFAMFALALIGVVRIGWFLLVP